MVKKLLLLFLLVSISSQAQSFEPETLFSKQIEKHIKKYRIIAKNAYRKNNVEDAQRVFDTLVHSLKEARLDDFTFRKFSGKKVSLYEYEKPIYLMTYAAWCTPGEGEIPALNDVVKKHHKDIDFIVLFWNTKEEVKKIAGQYNSKVKIVYVDELENKNCRIIRMMKHTLGFPTSILLNEDKTIVTINRGVSHAYTKDFSYSYDLHFNAFMKGVSQLKSVIEDSSNDLVVE